MVPVLEITLTGQFSVTVEAMNKNPAVCGPHQAGQQVALVKNKVLEISKIGRVPSTNFLLDGTVPANDSDPLFNALMFVLERYNNMHYNTKHITYSKTENQQNRRFRSKKVFRIQRWPF